MRKHRKHLFKGIHTFLETLGTTTFFGVLSFASDVGAVSDRHTTDEGDDIGLGNESVHIEIVDLKNELHLLINTRAVKSEHSIQKFLFIQVIVLIHIEHSEKPLTKQARQLTVIKHGNFIDSFVTIVAPILQIFVDVSEVG